jgi:hypothetical protein
VNPGFTTDKQFEKSWNDQSINIKQIIDDENSSDNDTDDEDDEEQNNHVSIEELIEGITNEEIPLLKGLKIEDREATFTFNYPGESLATDETKIKSQYAIQIIRSLRYIVNDFLSDLLNDDNKVHNIIFCVQQSDGSILSEEEFFEELKSLCAKSKKLRTQIENYVRSVAKYQEDHWQVWINDENGMAMCAAGILACANKNYMDTFITLLASMDLDHEVSSTEWVDGVVDRWGYCPETYYLIAARATLVQGQYGLEGLEDELKDHFSQRPSEIKKYLKSTIKMAKDFFIGEGKKLSLSCITNVIADKNLRSMHLTDLAIELQKLNVKTTSDGSYINHFTYTSYDEPNEENYKYFLDHITPRLLADIELAFIASKRNTLYLNFSVEFQQYKWSIAELLTRAVKYPSCKVAINHFLGRIHSYLKDNDKNVFFCMPTPINCQTENNAVYSYSPIMTAWVEPLITANESYLNFYCTIIKEANTKPFYLDKIAFEEAVNHYGITKVTMELVEYYLMNTPFPTKYQISIWDRVEKLVGLASEVYNMSRLKPESLIDDICKVLIKKYEATDFELIENRDINSGDEITAFIREAMKR